MFLSNIIPFLNNKPKKINTLLQHEHINKKNQLSCKHHLHIQTFQNH
jgi:hypothetical protein